MSDETMKFGRISDENLAAASKYSSAEDIDIRRMADEVRHWRGLLSPERVEALRFAADVMSNCTPIEPQHKRLAAAAALDALLTAAQEVERG